MPRQADGPGDDEIRQRFATFDSILYGYDFEGGLSLEARSKVPGPYLGEGREYFVRRFRHFMPHVLAAQKGTLEGKRVLDIACNSGFFSIQCALLGADVVGFDGRADVIEHANFIKSIAGIPNVDFRVLDFWAMDPESLGGQFDVVLNLGILYHLPKTLEGLERTIAMARDTVLLDTAVYPSRDPVIRLQWEEPLDIRFATERGVAAVPSKRSIELMLRHIGVSDWYEVPLRRGNPIRRYQADQQASWLISV